MAQLIGFALPILIGYFIGKWVEKRHYKSIQSREKFYLKVPAVTFKTLPVAEENIDRSQLVEGSVVISLDYFKRIIAAFSFLFGGRVYVYESLLDRARREAILRMKAKASGADLIGNVRIETSTIGANADQKKQIGSIEALAYGTAVYLKK